MKLLHTAAVLTLVGAAVSAWATEGGSSVYSPGTENYGCCALPPPGIYGTAYFQSSTVNKARGNEGQVVTPSGFKVRANALASRLIYVTPHTVMGGSLVVHTIIPLVNVDVHIAPGLSQNKSGLGDIVLGAGLGFHHSPSLHSVVAMDIYTPTGDYTQGDLANIGRNHWAFQPLAGFSLIDPKGFNADVKAMYTFNTRNRDTDYTDGQEFMADYSLGWGLGNGWVVGAGGYLYQQTTNDKQAGQTVANNKGRAFAIGPSIKYDSGHGWFLTAKYQLDSGVRNRAEGKALLVKLVLPL